MNQMDLLNIPEWLEGLEGLNQMQPKRIEKLARGRAERYAELAYVCLVNKFVFSAKIKRTK